MERKLFDVNGGSFHSDKHDTRINIPDFALVEQSELIFAATITAPVVFPENVVPVSPIIWLCMEAKLKKAITLCLPHSLRVKAISEVEGLCFAKASHSSSKATMKLITGDQFNTSCGEIDIDHFCYYCIVNEKLGVERIPNKFLPSCPHQVQEAEG